MGYLKSATPKELLVDHNQHTAITMSDRLSSANWFDTPETLPVWDIQTLVADYVLESILVVAPHPDDETLGCGGAIALLRQLNIPVEVLVVSDGTQSHPNSIAYPPFALKKLRESESLAALSILGVAPEAVTFLGMPDGAVPQVRGGETGMENRTDEKIPEERYLDAIASIERYLNSLIPSTVFLPWRQDPHPDHRASWQLFITAINNLINPPRIIEYPIWDWDSQQRGDFADSVDAWRLDISKVLELKRQAIACYRSQISDLIADDPEGFRLTPDLLLNFTQPWEIYLEVK